MVASPCGTPQTPGARLMNVLIVGGSGMLGHKLWQTLAGRFRTSVTLRRSADGTPLAGLFPPERTYTGVTAEDFVSVAGVVEVAKPDVVINCVGIVKQLPAARDPL